MKNRSKALLLALCALMLVVTTVFTTLAYLTDDATITNTFTVGNVEITLFESNTDVYGVTQPGTNTTGNQYKLIPNRQYVKDPKITLSDTSESAYLFVEITNEITAIEAGTTVAQQMAANGWTPVEGNVYVYAGSKATDSVVAPDNTVDVFATVTIKGDADVATYDGKEIELTAYAIQSDGFNSAQAAWEALKAELPAQG